MDIGYFCYSLSGAGPRIRARNLIEGLADRTSHDITLVTSIEEEFTHPEVEIHRLLSPRRLLSPFTFFRAKRALSGSDVVHVPVNFHQLLYARALYGGPIVAGAGIKHYLFHLNAVRLLGVSRMIETNEFEADIWQNAGIDADYVYPAVNRDRFTPVIDDAVAVRNRLGIPKNHDILLFVGSLTKQKGAHYVDELAARVRDDQISVVVVGDGQLRDHFLDREDLYFEGFVDNADLPSYYAAADVTLVPSDEETFSIVSLESIASGTPVVTTTSEDCYMHWLFADRGTYVWTERNVESLLSAAKKLLEDEERYRRQRERGFEAINTLGLSIDNSVDEHLRIYNEVTNSTQ